MSICWPFPVVVARPQRHQHAERAVEPGHVVGQRGGARRRGRPVRIAGEEGDAAEGVADAPEAGLGAVGAGLAVAGHAQHHELRVHRAQHVPAEAPAFERAGLEILGQHVGLGDELLQHLDALGRFQVERDRLLVARLRQPDQRVAAFADGAEAAAGIAHLGLLDLDHLGAELRHDRGAVGGGDVGRDVDDADAGERPVVGGGGWHCFFPVLLPRAVSGRDAHPSTGSG